MQPSFQLGNYNRFNLVFVAKTLWRRKQGFRQQMERFRVVIWVNLLLSNRLTQNLSISEKLSENFLRQGTGNLIRKPLSGIVQNIIKFKKSYFCNFKVWKTKVKCYFLKQRVWIWIETLTFLNHQFNASVRQRYQNNFHLCLTSGMNNWQKLSLLFQCHDHRNLFLCYIWLENNFVSKIKNNLNKIITLTTE